MRTNFDMTPFYRSSIGFDRVFDLLENASRVQPIDNWPPYDILRDGEDSYRISMAVAGFTPEDLTMTYQPNLLIVSGSKAGQDEGNYLHRGIPLRSFERRFELADFVEVSNASFENGILTVELKRELPETMKPRRIEIGMGSGSGQHAVTEPKQIEEQKQAA